MVAGSLLMIGERGAPPQSFFFLVRGSHWSQSCLPDLPKYGRLGTGAFSTDGLSDVGRLYRVARLSRYWYPWIARCVSIIALCLSDRAQVHCLIVN